MRMILKSCFSQKDSEYSEYLTYLLEKNDEYKSHGINLLGENLYLNFINFMVETYRNAGQFPSENLFLINFPTLPKDAFVNLSALPIDDFYIYIANYISKRIDKGISNRIKELPDIIADEGLTQEIADEIESLKKLSGKSKAPDIQLRQYSRNNYDERRSEPLGMVTGIAKLDSLIGGMDKGTVSVIAGFTSHYKTMFAMNAAYLNAYHYGYNIAYFSLETPKDMMYDQYLARHSYDMKFSQCEFIPHQKMRKCALTQNEYDYLYDVIEPDLYEDYIDKDGEKRKRGQTIFFDMQDFETFSFTEISNTLETLDDMLGGYLDAVIVDYVQLCKFIDGSITSGDDNRVINSYVAYFRKLAQSFRSGKKKKKLTIILLSQINRDSWKRASKNEGRYDLTCLADANELERGASRVFTTYTSENIKIVQEAQIQLLKNRNGATLWEPEKVFANPEACVYGDEMDSSGQTIDWNLVTSDVYSTLSALDSSPLIDNLF